MGHCGHGAPRQWGTACPDTAGALGWTPAGMSQLRPGGAARGRPSPGKAGSGGQECGWGWRLPRLRGCVSAAGCRRCLAASPIPSPASPSPAPRRPLLLPLLPPPRPLPALAAAAGIFWGSGETGPAAAAGRSGGPAQPSPRMHAPPLSRGSGIGSPPERGAGPPARHRPRAAAAAPARGAGSFPGAAFLLRRPCRRVRPASARGWGTAPGVGDGAAGRWQGGGARSPEAPTLRAAR